MRQRLLKVLILVLTCSTLLTSCARSTVFVKQGKPAQVREEIKDAKLWTADETGKLIESKGDIPKGAIVGVPPENITPVPAKTSEGTK